MSPTSFTRLTAPVWLRASLALIVMAAVTALSLTPEARDPGESAIGWVVHLTPSFVQNLLHVVIYAMLSASWVWTLSRHRRRVPVAFIIAAGSGALLEWLQTYVPGRFGSPIDIALNAVGAALGPSCYFGLIGIRGWRCCGPKLTKPGSRKRDCTHSSKSPPTVRQGCRRRPLLLDLRLLGSDDWHRSDSETTLN